MSRASLRGFFGAVLLGILTIGISSCGVERFGLGRWPVYKTPEKIELSESEKAALTAFAKEHEALYGKIHGRFLAYREIIRMHNAKAVSVNKEQLKALGYGSEEIEQLYPERKGGP